MAENQLTAFKEEVLLPHIWDDPNKAFPDFEFKKVGEVWQSYRNLSGKKKTKPGRSKITPGLPNIFGNEEQGKGVSLIDFFMQRNGISDFVEACKKLAEIYGEELPKGSQDWQERKKEEETLETVSRNAIDALKNYRTSVEASQVYNYLTKKRGYSEEIIYRMGVGYADSALKRNINKILSQIAERKGETYKPFSHGAEYSLLITHRDINGRIQGFKFRDITGTKETKYLNTPGLRKGTYLFSKTRIDNNVEDLILVEGELDTLHAVANGILNICSPMGNSLTPDQAKQIADKRPKRVTIFYDLETGKTKEETEKKIENTAKHIKETGDKLLAYGLDVYVAEFYEYELPDGSLKMDTDEYLKTHTKEEYLKHVKEAQSFGRWEYYQILKKYCKFDEEENAYLPPSTDKETNDLISEFYGLVDKQPNGEIRDRLEQVIQHDTGITKASLENEALRRKAIRDKEEQKNQAKKRADQIQELLNGGKTTEALKLMGETSRELSNKDREAEYSRYLIPTTEEEIRERYQRRGDDLRTGYTFTGNNEEDTEELLIPDRAITFVCAPPSHGKSTFLANLAIRIAERYPEKKILYLSYEEDKESVITNLLNVYVGEAISYNNRRTIRSDFKEGKDFSSKEKRETYLKKKGEFFSLLSSNRLNIRYCDYYLDELIGLIKYLRELGEVDLVFIDYVQLLNIRNNRKQRNEEVKDICIALKDLAVDERLGLPIILAAQFNREVESPLDLQSNKLAEASDLEKIANTVIGIWNCGFTREPTDKDATKTRKRILETQQTEDIKDSRKIYAKYLKRRGSVPNLEARLAYDGNSGLISDTYKAPTRSTPSSTRCVSKKFFNG